MFVVRIAITVFVVLILTVVALGWAWTSSYQPPPFRTASYLVLAMTALAGVFALARIWLWEGARIGRTK